MDGADNARRSTSSVALFLEWFARIVDRQNRKGAPNCVGRCRRGSLLAGSPVAERVRQVKTCPADFFCVRIKNQLAELQPASRHLKQRARLDVLEERITSREKLYIPRKLLRLLTRDSHTIAFIS